MVDLEQEGEHLLELLSPAEELRAAVPGLRCVPGGERPVLIGITDRRALVIACSEGKEAGRGHGFRLGFGVDDVTTRVAGFARGARMEVAGGDTIELDLGENALSRLRASVDGLAAGAV
jgi:hypothetical protein